jgi:hypothetical protein
MNPSTPSPSWLRPAALVVFLLLAGAMLAHISIALHPRFLYLNDAVESQRSLYNRTQVRFDGVVLECASWRNRVLLPYWLKAVTVVTGTSWSRAYLLTRWLTATCALGTFMLLTGRTLALSAWGAAGATGVFALSLVPTFLHLYEVPSDFLDATFFSLLVLSAIGARRGAFVIFLLIGLLNRESAIFALPIWWALHAFNGSPRVFFRESIWCGMLGVVGCALVIGLRHGNACIEPGALTLGTQPFNPLMVWSVDLRMLREYLARPNFSHAYFYLGGYLLFCALVLRAEWPGLGTRARRLVLCAAGLFVVSVVYGNLDELRIDIPPLVICSLVLTAIAQQKLAPAGTPNALG